MPEALPMPGAPQQGEPAIAAPPSPTRLQLLSGFAGLGLMGFGGVLPFARRLLVEDKRWLTGEEFADLLGLCQFLPGGNIVNLSIAIGLRYAGISGALAAFCGLMLPPTAIVIGLGAVYLRFRDHPVVEHGLMGLAATAGGLLIAMTLRLATPLLRRYRSLAVAVLVFLAIGVLRWPLPVVLFGAMVLSLVLHRRAA